MLHPSFASVVPADISQDKIDCLLEAYALSQVRFAEIINRRPGKQSKPYSEYVRQIMTFANIAMNK